MGRRTQVMVGLPRETEMTLSRLECRTREGESPVATYRQSGRAPFPSSAGHEQPCANLGGPPPKANYTGSPIVHEYREGTVKSTPGGE